jgi:hypothetical protein
MPITIFTAGYCSDIYEASKGGLLISNGHMIVRTEEQKNRKIRFTIFDRADERDSERLSVKSGDVCTFFGKLGVDSDDNWEVW